MQGPRDSIEQIGTFGILNGAIPVSIPQMCQMPRPLLVLSALNQTIPAVITFTRRGRLHIQSLINVL